jgi:hypothetical protein
MAPPTAGSGIDCLRRRVQNPLARRIVPEWPRADIPTLPGSAELGDPHESGWGFVLWMTSD